LWGVGGRFWVKGALFKRLSPGFKGFYKKGGFLKGGFLGVFWEKGFWGFFKKGFKEGNCGKGPYKGPGLQKGCQLEGAFWRGI